MQVYPAENPELVPEIQGPFYEGAQVSFLLWISNGRDPPPSPFLTDILLIGYTQTFEMDHAKRQGTVQQTIHWEHTLNQSHLTARPRYIFIRSSWTLASQSHHEVCRNDSTRVSRQIQLQEGMDCSNMFPFIGLNMLHYQRMWQMQT